MKRDKIKDLQEILVEFVYEGIENNYEDEEWLKNRCILWPHNDSTTKMNDQVMDSVQTGNINGAGHPSEFSPRGGGGEGTLSFPAASSKASFSVHSEYILF